jgi:sulfatase maturation enzyme AslB (radical SAM superfamily)
MIKYSNIREVHLEISTFCNAACPLCPRNFRGYPYNDGYPELNFTLDSAHRIFSPTFLKQLKSIRINGNYGDIVMNPEAVEIVRYFKQHNQHLAINISTNGSARTADFWRSLAELDTQVLFCLDGLEDTHHLYRQNTSWTTIIKNAQTYISAGGKATWKFIKFDHNIHQLNECKQLSKDLKFNNFQIVDHGRNIGPVFDKHGNHTHVIGKYSGTTEFKILFHKKQTDTVLLEDIIDMRVAKKTITCSAIEDRSIYIAANGDVSPCCWTGFYPQTYGAGEYHQAINAQLKPLSTKNNALEQSLEECVQWFDNVKQKWDIDSYDKGRLIVCDDNCGN